jgi:hypothetical protein
MNPVEERFQEIDRVIRKEAFRQAQSAEWNWDKDDLASEAWAAVLEGFKKDRHLSLGEITIIVRRQLSNYKIRMRDCLSFPASHPPRDGKSLSAFPIPIDVLERDAEDIVNNPGIPKLRGRGRSLDNHEAENQHARDMEIAIAAVRERLTWVDQQVLDELKLGGKVTDVWKRLDAQGIKQAKVLVFSAPKRIAAEIKKEMGRIV